MRLLLLLLQLLAFPYACHIYNGTWLARRKCLISFYAICLSTWPHPPERPSGQWNCSLPGWSVWSQQLRCNMITECAGGEDEQDCPYNGHCGDGRLTINNTCYLYIYTLKRISWYNASAQCQRYLSNIFPEAFHTN